MREQRGFTLVELVTVVVILGIVGALGSGFFISFLESYKVSQDRSNLIARGRVVMEQVARQARLSVPYSVRVSASGNCVEFMPSVAGANYFSPVPDVENNAADISSLATSAFSITRGVGRHALIGALSSSDIYANGNPLGRVAISSIGLGSYSSLTFTAGHQFTRNSINRRVFVADNPLRFCFASGSSQFVRYTNYGLNTGSVTDSAPSGVTTTLMADNVSASQLVFVLSAGSEDRNALLTMVLTFSEGEQSVSLSNKILIRNVP